MCELRNGFKLLLGGVFPLVFSCFIGSLFVIWVIGGVESDLNSIASLVSQEELEITNSELILNNQVITFPHSHELLGEIKIEAINFKEQLVYGTDQAELVEALGFYSNSKLPGLGSNVVVIGLRNKMVKLQNLSVGDEIEIQMSYGDYIYTISDIQIVDKSNREHFKKTSIEQLTLVTDYPFDEWGIPIQSFVVIADLKMVR